MQDTENPSLAHCITPLQKEAAKAPGILCPKPSSLRAVNAGAARPSLAARVMGFFTRLFSRKAAPKTLPAIMALKEPKQVVFKSTSVSTFITPLGNYAGTPRMHVMRAAAIEEFHRMKASTGATIN